MNEQWQDGVAAGAGQLSAEAAAQARRLRLAAHAVLSVVAVMGAALSYTSLQRAAARWFDGALLSYGFPLLVDALVLGASLQFVAAARTRSAGRFGWRLTAHAGIGGTLLLNALAALDGPRGGAAAVPWHVTAPAVWAVLVELYARGAAGAWKSEQSEVTARIPLRLWLTAPVESARTWLRQARLTAAVAARFEVGRHAAAVEALRLTLSGRPGRRVRRVLRRQLRAGSLTPDAVLEACGWHATGQPASLDAHAVLRAALTGRPGWSGCAGGVGGVGGVAGCAGTPGESGQSGSSAAAVGRKVAGFAVGVAGEVGFDGIPGGSVAGTAPAVADTALASTRADTYPILKGSHSATGRADTMTDTATVPASTAQAPPVAGTTRLHPRTDAQILAEIGGEPPSIRALMREYGIGQVRATRLRQEASAALRGSAPAPRAVRPAAIAPGAARSPETLSDPIPGQAELFAPTPGQRTQSVEVPTLPGEVPDHLPEPLALPGETYLPGRDPQDLPPEVCAQSASAQPAGRQAAHGQSDPRPAVRNTLMEPKNTDQGEQDPAEEFVEQSFKGVSAQPDDQAQGSPEQESHPGITDRVGRPSPAGRAGVAVAGNAALPDSFGSVDPAARRIDALDPGFRVAAPPAHGVAYVVGVPGGRADRGDVAVPDAVGATDAPGSR